MIHYISCPREFTQGLRQAPWEISPCLLSYSNLGGSRNGKFLSLSGKFDKTVNILWVPTMAQTRRWSPTTDSQDPWPQLAHLNARWYLLGWAHGPGEAALQSSCPQGVTSARNTKPVHRLLVRTTGQDQVTDVAKNKYLLPRGTPRLLVPLVAV